MNDEWLYISMFENNKETNERSIFEIFYCGTKGMMNVWLWIGSCFKIHVYVQLW